MATSTQRASRPDIVYLPCAASLACGDGHPTSSPASSRRRISSSSAVGGFSRMYATPHQRSRSRSDSARSSDAEALCSALRYSSAKVSASTGDTSCNALKIAGPVRAILTSIVMDRVSQPALTIPDPSSNNATVRLWPLGASRTRFTRESRSSVAPGRQPPRPPAPRSVRRRPSRPNYAQQPCPRTEVGSTASSLLPYRLSCRVRTTERRHPPPGRDGRSASSLCSRRTSSRSWTGSLGKQLTLPATITSRPGGPARPI